MTTSLEHAVACNSPCFKNNNGK